MKIRLYGYDDIEMGYCNVALPDEWLFKHAGEDVELEVPDEVAEEYRKARNLATSLEDGWNKTLDGLIKERKWAKIPDKVGSSSWNAPRPE